MNANNAKKIILPELKHDSIRTPIFVIQRWVLAKNITICPRRDIAHRLFANKTNFSRRTVRSVEHAV